jgi:ABC-2 type transport system ATP-binding protein
MATKPRKTRIGESCIAPGLPAIDDALKATGRGRRMIDVQRLTKTFGTHVALNDVTFRVPRATVVGLLGRNGAGKTTLLRILAGVIRPTAGRVLVAGLDGESCPLGARGQIGYLAESAPLYPELRVMEHLSFRASQKRIARKERLDRVKRSLSLVDAWQWRDNFCGHLSRGMRQRVGLADALLAEPPVLLLDEPTAGLDPNQAGETRELIDKLGQTGTIIVATHVLTEVDAICDSAIVIERGMVVAEGSLPELHALGRSSNLAVTLRATADQAEVALRECPAPRIAVEQVEAGVVRIVLSCPSEMRIEELAEFATAILARRGIPIREIRQETASLEQIFSKLTAVEEQRR